MRRRWTITFLRALVLNRWYTALAVEAGVRRITSHGARRTSGSSYALMGAGQKVIARLLGHADTAATERYTHVAADATTALDKARWARLVGAGTDGRQFDPTGSAG
ncbi:MAG: tyrosine-type recombinase/integrase [Myxococcota bacterium]